MRRMTVANRAIPVIFAVSLVIITGLNLAARYRFLSRVQVFAEQHISADGIVYDLRDDRRGTDWLRAVSPDSRLIAHVPFKQPEGSECVSRHIADVAGGVVYIYEYTYDIRDYSAISAAVIACDIESGKMTEIWREENKDEALLSRRIWNNKLYLGYMSASADSQKTLSVARLDILSGEIEEILSISVPFSVSYFHVTADGRIVIATPASEIWRYGGQWELIFRVDAPGALSSLSIAEDGTVYAYAADGNGGGRLWEAGGDGQFHQANFDADVKSVSIANRDTWVAVNESYDYRISFMGKVSTVSHLSVPFMLLWSRDILQPVFWEALPSLALAALGRHFCLKRKTSLIAKQVLIAIPVFSVGLFLLLGSITAHISDEMEESAYDNLLLYASEVLDTVNGGRFSRIDWENPYGDEYYLFLKDEMGRLSEGKSIKWWDENLGAASNTPFYSSTWLYRVDGDNIYAACCSNIYVNLEVSYVYKAPRNSAMDELLKRGIPTRGRMYGSTGEGYWMVLFTPVFDNGRLVGIIETATPMLRISSAVSGIGRSIFTATICVLGAALIAYITLTGFSLRTLNRLKLGACAITGGVLDTRVNVRGTDETADIAAAFNTMADSVEKSIQNISTLSAAYSRFVPKEMLSILKKDTVAEVKRGDFAELPATYILISTNSFDSLREKEFLDALNCFYAIVIPHVAGIGGVIEHCSGRHMTALYEGGTEKALNAVINAFASIGRNMPGIECGVVLSHSPALLGVIGWGERLNLLAVSPLSYESERIGGLCASYGCRLLLTRSAYCEMGEGISRYRRRLLGYISVSGEREPVYDFYDCESSLLMRGKEATAKAFEEAVENYYTGEYEKARNLLIDIIKQSPLDLAAREYLKKSHSRLESGLPPDVLLEL